MQKMSDRIRRGDLCRPRAHTAAIRRYVYTNDTQGRPVSAEITRDPAGDYVSEKFEYTYNDVYFFDIADLAETEE